MEPDFQDFARVWVGNDRRLADLQPEAATALMAKMAQALDSRRRRVQEEAEEGHLVVNIDPSRFGPEGLDSEAWDQLAELIKEHDAQPPEKAG